MKLHHAVEVGDEDVVRTCLRESPMSVSQVDERGWTALHVVASLGKKCTLAHAVIAKLLLRAGADVNSRGPLGWTPIHMIAINGSKKSMPVAEVLLENGADLSAVTNDGVTDWWMLWQHGPEIKALLSAYERSGQN
jgi:ankyrin repeat protein